MAPSGGGNVKVVVRVRPFNTRELDRKAQCVVSMNGEQTIVTPPTGDRKLKDTKASLQGPRTFAYDKSYWSFNRDDDHFAGQDSLFEDLGKPLLDNAFQGYNNCIFAYGQTGSGKSYSMMGYGPEAGVIPRICKSMFERIEHMQRDSNAKCTVEVSYLEIYNERVRDLLNPATKGNLKVREHPSTGPYVEDLAKLVVRSFQEIESLMDEGNKARTVAATNMNETSSRSHAVFTLTLVQKHHDSDTNMDLERAAKISLVDLAGSERATATGATGARLKEGAEINRSLSTLGRVIAALAEVSSGKKKNMSMVPYRDSVLTWLLKDSLGGNSLTAMIAAISPADINYEETLSTLRYADSAKRIKQHAIVNEDANARMIRELKEELAQLRSKLGSGNTDGGMVGEVQQYPPDTPLDKQMVSITGPDGNPKQVSKAEIAEQLSQSEKLYQDLNQTWEQKLQKTEEVHKEREAALEELGISIDKGFIGLSTPKKMPHLVNLSDDPLLSECLVYNLKPGMTTAGNDEMTDTAEIRLKGSKILKEHCVFENKDDIVTVTPNDEAAVMVNGLRVTETKRLRSGYRVILGDFHIFRFNHPQEARAERDEYEQGSKLKHSMNADDFDDSPSRNRFSDVSRPDLEDVDGQMPSDSPTLYGQTDHDYDWSFARREAATAILGPDQKIQNLTDEELDVLYDDLQRVRANRNRHLSKDFDNDSDSAASFPIREKYLSAATLDNFSLDTALTAPSTPPRDEDAERLQMVKEEMQSHLQGQKDDMNSTLNLIEQSDDQDTKVETSEMERNFQQLKQEMEEQLRTQKEEYERQLDELRSPSRSPSRVSDVATVDAEMTSRQKSLATWALEKWRQRKYVRMATLMLQHAATLKEAQILSQQLGQSVVFQFAIVDHGQNLGSSYDMVLVAGIDGDEDDDISTAPKPCLAVRLVDFKHESICLWSLEKLQKRLPTMRQMQQYLERPEYMQHFRIENPFSESCMPQYSRIGDAQVALAAVFESRVQDFEVDVVSPYTFNVIGILKLSLEPSLADAPASTLKFNVVLHEITGFPEVEGSCLHAQLFVSRVSEDGGVTTSQLIEGFGDGPARFESLHGMSLPSSSSRDSHLRIALFAKASATHLDKLLSWDDMRDASRTRPHESNGTRVAETEYRTGERHDVFVQAQIMELSETGSYEPVEVISNDSLDHGAFQLHQGLQRRIVIQLTHTCGELLPWHEIVAVRTGSLCLLDTQGKMPETASNQADIPLKLVSRPTMIDNADGTSNVKIVGQWDSSAHDSALLDRTTSDKHRVQLSLTWNVTSLRLTEPLKFTLDIALQVRPRTFLRQQSMLSQFWAAGRTTHSNTGIFAVDIKPTPVKSAMDLWRMDTQYDYVKGEEMLAGWAPRSVSLIRDYIDFRKRVTRAAGIESAKSVFGKHRLVVEGSSHVVDGMELTHHQNTLLEKYLAIWQSRSSDLTRSILSSDDTSIHPTVDDHQSNATLPPPLPAAATKGSLSAAVHFQPKNPLLLKGGYLLTPDATSTRWVRRYLELRLPFLHVHSVPDGDEINAINLSDSRVDHRPDIAQLLNKGAGGELYVFAIYARNNSFLFASKSERERVEWILKIDESYFGTRGGGR